MKNLILIRDAWGRTPMPRQTTSRMMVTTPPICNRFGVLHGADGNLWGSCIFMIAVSAWFYGAPGEIRTPDLVVRSHALYPTELRARIRKAADSTM